MTKGGMKKDVQLSIRVPAELRDELLELATADKRKLAGYITIVLEQHVQQARAKPRTGAKGKS